MKIPATICDPRQHKSMWPIFIFSSLSIFSWQSRASLIVEEFLSQFVLPDSVEFEPTKLEGARKSIKESITYFELEFERYNISESAINNQILLLLEYGQLFFAFLSPSSIVESEHSEIAVFALYKYLQENLDNRGLDWMVRLRITYHTMDAVRDSLYLISIPQFGELLKLLEDDKKKIVIDMVQQNLFAERWGIDQKWKDDDFSVLKNSDQIVNLKNTIKENYSKAVYLLSKQKDYYSDLFKPLRVILEDHKKVFTDGEFGKFSLEFKNFFLYKHFSMLSEESLFRIFFQTPNHERMKEVFGRVGFLVPFCQKKFESAKGLIDSHLGTDWKTEYPGLEEEGDEIMERLFFSSELMNPLTDEAIEKKIGSISPETQNLNPVMHGSGNTRTKIRRSARTKLTSTNSHNSTLDEPNTQSPLGSGRTMLIIFLAVILVLFATLVGFLLYKKFKPALNKFLFM